MDTNTNISSRVLDSSIPILVSRFEIHRYRYLVLEAKVLVNNTDSIAHPWTEIPIPVKLSGPQ